MRQRSYKYEETFVFQAGTDTSENGDNDDDTASCDQRCKDRKNTWRYTAHTMQPAPSFLTPTNLSELFMLRHNGKFFPPEDRTELEKTLKQSFSVWWKKNVPLFFSRTIYRPCHPPPG